MTKWKLYESPYTKCIGIGYQVKDIEECKSDSKNMLSFYYNNIKNISKCLPSDICSENNLQKTTVPWQRYLKYNNSYYKYGNQNYKCNGKGSIFASFNDCIINATKNNLPMISYFYNPLKKIHKCFISKPCISYNLEFTNVKWQRYIFLDNQIDNTTKNNSLTTSIAEFNTTFPDNLTTSIMKLNTTFSDNLTTNIIEFNTTFTTNVTTTNLITQFKPIYKTTIYANKLSKNHIKHHNNIDFLYIFLGVFFLLLLLVGSINFIIYLLTRKKYNKIKPDISNDNKQSIRL